MNMQTPAGVATCLLADIGGTHARFIIEHETGQFSHLSTLQCAHFQDLTALLHAYLETLPFFPQHAAIAIAQPIDGDQIHMTNLNWSCSIHDLQQHFGFSSLDFINDFQALAYALPFLTAQDRQIIGDIPLKDIRKNLALFGSGTGLGVSALIPIAQHDWVALSSEGGHQTFAAHNKEAMCIEQCAKQYWQHVSYERVLSGAGLSLIYEALSTHVGQPQRPLPQEIITQAEQAHPTARATLHCFSQLCGTFAGNLALTFGAEGGVYIGGGVIPKLGKHFDAHAFRHAFENKGRFAQYLKKIPTCLITAPNPCFLGLSMQLKQRLGKNAALKQH